MSMSVETAPTPITSTNDDEAQCEEVLCSMIAGDEKEPSPTTTTTPEFIPTKPGQQQKEKTTNGKKRFSTAARISSHKLYAASMNSQPLNWSSIFPDLGKDAVQPTDASALLKNLPRGAYTTCRTIGKGTQIYQFDYHVERLVTSAQAMIESGIVDEENEDYTQVTDLEKVRKSVMSSVKATIQQFRLEFGDDMLPCDEFRITLLSTWLPPEDSIEKEKQKNNCNMYCHVTILPYRDTQNSHIKVEIHGHGRSNAIAKDSKWISQREDSKEHNCEEYILVNDEGEMLEGTQTNFYVVVKNREKNGDGIGGVVVTAEEGILKGSVRDSVLRVCEQHGIPVELRPPKLSDLEHATGAFLSSTSRLVMPIHEAVVNVSEKDIDGGDGSGEGSDGYGSGEELLEAMGQSYHFPDCKLTQRIQRLVAEDVLTHCVSIE